ncbi:complement factor H-like isoform X1 [Branchiostoma floridae]|uniref:Complement factor H-like isoform X1 n=1 Tax=Branchiostoma floridae TaxID=7739 RepID=A0A9J7MDK5_BRAFL|nr:complement factor H-like isoform X1 [Branchiostoma floridae]
MIRLRVLLTLVLIAALLWESEALFSWRNRRYSRRYRRTRPTSACSSVSLSGRGVRRTVCTFPYGEGETCELSCIDGYRQTSGDTSRTCSGGSWSGQPLVCEYTGCDRPPYTEGSREDCWWPYENGENCTYTCRNGYARVSGDSVITCENGNWSGTPLTCEYTGCEWPPFTRGSWRQGCRWPYENGENCTYTCRNGYARVSGDSVITCENGNWSGTPLTCEYTGCEWPPFTSGSRRRGCWWPYENGENCTYTCQEGHSRVSGDSTITCVDGSWSGTPLECQRTSGCDPPPRRFGSWGPRDCRWPYVEGETCRFQCQWGWEQQSGETTTTCTGGQWTGDPLVCTRSSSWWWPWGR